MTVQVPLTRGAIAVIDDDDAERVLAKRWYVVVKSGQVVRYAGHGWKENGKIHQIRMHRFILGLVPGDGVVVDHVNSDGLDNRRCNLRHCSLSENTQNRRKFNPTSSRFKGVSFDWRCPARPWRATIGSNGSFISIGRFEDEAEAARAYDAAARGIFGEFAKTNFDDASPFAWHPIAEPIPDGWQVPRQASANHWKYATQALLIEPASRAGLLRAGT